MNLSETKYKDGGNTRTSNTSKQSKPFCGIAYLAKSTIAVNGISSSINNNNNDNDKRITNGHSSSNGSNCQPPASPNVAATAKVTAERRSPALPTGAATAVNGHDSLLSPSAETSKQSRHVGETSSRCQKNGAAGMADIFGEINEEEAKSPTIAHDQVDGSSAALDSRRPWEMSNSYVRRVPPSLMPATQNGFAGHQQHHHNANGLTSLTSKLNSLDCWDYTIELECLKGPQDLQLAAELGKTLLERNKELETLLKEHKSTVEEQEQEIVYLKKHTTALREVNDSRLKVYEQLEVGIQDLERANHRLLVENTSDKKHIKTLVHNLETLEARCDELNKQMDETRQALSMERRKNERLLQEKNGAGQDGAGVRLKPVEQKATTNGHNGNSGEMGYDANTTAPENCSFAFQSPFPRNNANSTGISGSGNDDRSLDLSMVCAGEDNDEIIKLVNDLETTKRAFMAEQQRCGELEEQLVAIIQENQTLQSRIAQTSANEEMKSMHDELSILDEVRQGQMCSRCLRAVEDRVTVNDEQSSIAPTEEDGEDDEERSLLELVDGVGGSSGHRGDNDSEHSQIAYRSSVSIKVSPRLAPDSLEMNAPASPNPYRDLVEKYEALLEVQRSSIARKSNNSYGGGVVGLSLAEEFQSSAVDFQSSAVEFNQTQKLMMQAAAAVAADNCNASSNGDGASSCNGSMSNDPATNDKSGSDGRGGNARGRTPTEFSEAETSSSGFSDETSTKFTQTDDRPGYFLCSIGDGEDCKFSIYDDASPIDSRFRNRPEYRELFKEIFAVLKKAAENKEEGDKLPLLDDTNPSVAAVSGATAARVPPVTPANEELPADFGDDAQSIISSAVSEQSFAMSECITKMERKTAKKHIIEKNQENKPPSLATSISQLAASGVIPSVKQIVENGRVLTPLKREPLEYLSVGVGIKKKNRKKNRNFSNDRSESPVALPSPPRFFVTSGKKRKDARPFVQSPMVTTPEHGSARPTRAGAKFEWNGSSMVIYNRSANSPQHGAVGLRGRELDLSGIEYRPSTVSQDLHKLKKLDLSYAEVLRRADACKQHQHQQQQQRRQRHHHH